MRRRGDRLFHSWVALLVLVSLVLMGCGSKEEKKAGHLEKAREYIAKNELRKAAIELKNVVQLDPWDDAAFVELGETYLKLQEGGEAFKAFSKAATINPGNLKAQLKVGQIFLLGRQAEEARKKADLILQDAPDNIEGLSLLSGVQVQEKDLEGDLLEGRL